MNAPLHPNETVRPAARLGDIGVSEILRVTAKAAALERSGRPMIVLVAGEPDFDTSDNVEEADKVKEAANRAIAEGATKYTALDGTPELGEAARRTFWRENSLDFEQDEVTCGAGAEHVLYIAFLATLDQAARSSSRHPAGRTTATSSRPRAGQPVIVRCGADAGFRLRPERREAAITDRTRCLLLDPPPDPSGVAYPARDLVVLAEVVRRHDQVWVTRAEPHAGDFPKLDVEQDRTLFELRRRTPVDDQQPVMAACCYAHMIPAVRSPDRW